MNNKSTYQPRPDLSPIIEIQDLYKSFGDNHVLKGFNLNIEPGENIAILGRSGSGKSVLIKCIVRLLASDSGTLNVLGQSIPDLSYEELDEVRKRIGFLFQGNALYDSMTVKENLEFPLKRQLKENVNKGELDDRVINALDDVGLAYTLNMMPSELSGGMKKRVALARTLIMEPDIILYDEPTSGLDPITSREISDLILEMQSEHHATAIVITHDIACCRITGNKTVVLVEGVNRQMGTFEEVSNSSDPEVRAFFL